MKNYCNWKVLWFIPGFALVFALGIWVGSMDGPAPVIYEDIDLSRGKLLSNNSGFTQRIFGFITYSVIGDNHYLEMSIPTHCIWVTDYLDRLPHNPIFTDCVTDGILNKTFGEYYSIQIPIKITDKRAILALQEIYRGGWNYWTEELEKNYGDVIDYKRKQKE